LDWEQSSTGRGNLVLGLFRREQRSLFGEILDWMLTPLLLLWPLSLALTWWVAQGIAAKPFDRLLQYQLEVLVQQVQDEPNRLEFELNDTLRLRLRSDDTDLLYFQVQGVLGQTAVGDPDLPAPALTIGTPLRQTFFRDDVMYGEDVRVAYMWLPGRSFDQGPVLIQVAESLNKRSMLSTEIIKGVMVPQFIILPLSVLMVWLALSRGIRPLNTLERRIRERRPNDLSPLDEGFIPQEVAPLVSSINQLLMRLKSSLTTQRRFLADAAHQLKTPLAGLRMQADLAQRQANPAELQDALQKISQSTVRATRTVNQLLALARAESMGRSSMPTSSIDLAPIVIGVVQDCVPMALDKELDLGFEGPENVPPSCLIEGNPTLLQEMVRNLVDNAIHYTPPRGVITARILVDRFSGVLVLQVEDSGPGIPEGERALVMQPFYRALGTNVEGSGLGLAIVQEVAQQHGAVVELEDTHPQQQPPGLRINVRFMPR